MPKVRSLKAKADYRGPGSKGKFQATDVQIDWEGPVLHHKEGLFWKKLAFKDVVEWQVGAEPGGKPDKFGRLKILNIIKLQEVTHGRKNCGSSPSIPTSSRTGSTGSSGAWSSTAKISLSKEEIKQSPLLAKHKLKTTVFQNVSVFDRTHQIFINTLNILQFPYKHEKLPSTFDTRRRRSKIWPHRKENRERRKRYRYLRNHTEA